MQLINEVMEIEYNIVIKISATVTRFCDGILSGNVCFKSLSFLFPPLLCYTVLFDVKTV